MFVLDTMRNRRFGADEVREKFGVGPEQVGDVLALMGDSIDNVPGVDGIGPKTAAELINKFGSLDVLLERVSEVKGKRGIAIAAARSTTRCGALISRDSVKIQVRFIAPGAIHPIQKRRD
ncbi:MAG TPA: 5'-3' exonuclease H3TH domain-containing protein, partial [Polyangia bacterium]|nr:5'-3' exonuclease H3TH domain-containing protein [Polyangia bacterium]